MLFNSLSFAVFLPIVFCLYWVVPHKYRWILMLVSSYYFYMSWNAKYVFLILATTFVSYLSAIFIEKENNKNKKKAILFGAAVVCLGTLFFFKYFNFFFNAISAIFSLFTIGINTRTLNLILPVGISFYTFQTLSYVVDVYRGTAPAEHHFGYYATFISFFPQLVAGPIERTNNLLPQIKAKHKFDYDQATYGLKLMAWGYFKKIVIADTLSQYVSSVYDNPHRFAGFALVLATAFFTIQIYCDFSGYSDIAIGTAKLLGINLMTNFKSPYFSQSIREFWSRWHISLSTWLRDYIYIPLGGSRAGKIRHIFNLLVTFLVSGLWHGANWTFVAWGGIHGVLQALEAMLLPKYKQKSNGVIWWIRAFVVFCLVSLGWIFFVSNSVSDAAYVIVHLFSGIKHPLAYMKNGLIDMGLETIKIVCISIEVLCLAIYDYCSLKVDCIKELSQKPIIIRYTFYSILLCMLLLLRASGQTEFVYFQF